MEPVRAWGVRLGGGGDETEGNLSLEEDALVFTIAEGELRLPLASIRKARRIRGSPVLVVHCDEDGAPARFAFFFAKPPPLKPRGRESKGRAKRRSAGYLVTSASEHKETLSEWEQAIREAVARRG